jgi:chromosome partitioning protein
VSAKLEFKKGHFQPLCYIAKYPGNQLSNNPMQNSDIQGAGSLRVIERSRPRNILIANSKGGCGKTTLATNLAAYFSRRGRATALMDCDPQGSSSYWLKLRPQEASPITGISGVSQYSAAETRNFQQRVPRGIERVVVDTSAGLSGTQLYNRIRDADLIIVPILPSPIDIHSAVNFVREIEITGCLRESNKQLLVIANRARANTVMFATLNEFLLELGLPRVTHTRDSQLYIRAAAQGLGIADLSRSRAEAEKDRWIRIGSWIENYFALRANNASGELSRLADRFSRS